MAGRIRIGIAVGVLFVASTMAGCATRESSVSPTDPGFRALNSGDYVKARAIFGPELARSPNDPYLQLDLGLAYQGMGRPDAAAVLYREVLIDGRDVYAKATTRPSDAGKSLAQIACQNLKGGVIDDDGC